MERMMQTVEMTVPQGRTLRVQDGKGLDLHVVAGRLWITQAEDTEDKVLEATESFRVGRDGVTFAHAFKEVRLRITSPAEAGAPTLTLGGYRQVGESVVRMMFAEWFQGIGARIAAGTSGRSAQPGRA